MSNQSRFVLRTMLFWLVVATIISPPLLLYMWFGHVDCTVGRQHTPVPCSTAWKVVATLEAGIFIPLAWRFYGYLKKRAKYKEQQIAVDQMAEPVVPVPRQPYMDVVDKALSGGYKPVSVMFKYEGWKLRIEAIITFAVGVVVILVGLVFALLFRGAALLFAVSLLALGLIGVFGGRYYWKRAKSLVQGKFD